MTARRLPLIALIAFSSLSTAAFASSKTDEYSPRPSAVSEYPLSGAHYRGPLDIDVMSSRPRPTHAPMDSKLFPGASRDGQASSVGILGISLDEGPLLETMLWGGGGAVVGSFAGPLGTVVGAAVGATAGFLTGLVFAPANASVVPCTGDVLPKTDGSAPMIPRGC